MKNNPKISIIIPAFNEENLLPGCLETISLQDYPNFEVIVVDNASADKTKEIILSYTEKFSFFTYVFAGPPGRGRARNAGLTKATGEIIAMIDADCLAPPDWLRRLTEKIVKGEEVATMGFEADKIKNYWTRARQDEDWNFLKTRLKDDYAHHIDTKNFAIRSDILKDLKFDTRLIAYEDWDLFIRCQAAGHKIRFLPEIIVAHHHDSSLFQLFKTQFYRGRESLFIIKKYKKMPDCRQIFRNDQNFRAARLINFLTFFPWVIWQFVCRPKRAPYLVVSDAAWKAGLIAFWLHPKKRLDN